MNNRQKSLRLIRTIVLTLIMGAVTSCSDGPVSTTSNANTLTVLVAGADERITAPSWDDDPKMFVYLPLVRYSYDQRDGGPTGGLAGRLEPNQDRTEWTVYLNQNIRWHDGVPVTAHDIKFTVDLWNHPDINHYAGANFGEVTIIDDYTFLIQYDKPSRALIGGWDVFYPWHLLKGLPPAEFMNWDFWTRPVGNGPYRYVRHTKKTMMEFEANPDFYLGKPRIEKLILKFASKSASGIAELRSGSVDALLRVSPIDTLALRDSEDIRTHFRLSGTPIQIAWNHRFPLFSDARVRRALTHALDRRALHSALNFPSTLPLTDGVYTDSQLRRGEIQALLPYDLEKALGLMAVSGWKVDAEGTLRDVEGRAFRFTLQVSQDFNLQAAVLIQSQLQYLGVEMDILPLEASTIRGNIKNGAFEAALHILGASRLFHHRPFFSGDHPIGYQNDAVDEIYARLSGVLDRAEWDAGYEEISAIFLNDIPVTFLYPIVHVSAATNRLKGYTELDSDGITDFNIAFDIHKYWLEDK